jgi:hypothetical protein
MGKDLTHALRAASSHLERDWEFEKVELTAETDRFVKKLRSGTLHCTYHLS